MIMYHCLGQNTVSCAAAGFKFSEAEFLVQSRSLPRGNARCLAVEGSDLADEHRENLTECVKLCNMEGLKRSTCTVHSDRVAVTKLHTVVETRMYATGRKGIN